MLVHAPATLRRLGIRAGARDSTCSSCSPSSCRPAPPRRRRAGLCLALDLDPPTGGHGGGGSRLARTSPSALLRQPRAGRGSAAQPGRRAPRRLDGRGRLGLGAVRDRPRSAEPRPPCRAAKALKVWEAAARMGGGRAPCRRPASHPVDEAEARARLAVDPRTRAPSSGPGRRTTRAPSRPPSRRASSGAIRISFWPRPAPVPARRSATSPRRACGPRRTAAAVWISTFTRHLQRQIDGELARVFPRSGAAPPPGGACAKDGKTIYAC